MLSVRKNVVAVQEPIVYEHADFGVSRFGFIHHGLAWQCRLDATGDSWLRLAHERKARSLIPADRIKEILAAPDDDAAIADAIIAEFLRRGSRHLPHELVAHVRGFTIAWVRDAQRIMRRQRQRAGALSTAASALTLLAHTEPAVD
ncbi:MAG TPA: hypothetical protein VFI49_00355 [Rudaea sp.]|nr:hypothetical protein [Rudaea sp.]